MEDGQQLSLLPEPSQAELEDRGKQCMDFTNSSMRIICKMMHSHMRLVQKHPDIMEEIDEAIALWGTVLHPGEGLLDLVKDAVKSLTTNSFMKQVVNVAIFDQVVKEVNGVIKDRAALEKAVPKVQAICAQFETIRKSGKCSQDIKDSKFKRGKIEQATQAAMDLILDVKKLRATCGEEPLLFSDAYQALKGGLRSYCEETLSALQRSCLDVFVPLILKWANAEFGRGDEHSLEKALESVQDGLYGACGVKNDLLIFSTTETISNVDTMFGTLSEAFWLQHTM